MKTLREYIDLIEQASLNEMDKSQDPPGRDDPYDYSKGKWTKAEPVKKKKIAKDLRDTLGKAFKGELDEDAAEDVAKLAKEMRK
jgi:hypothetical protein